MISIFHGKSNECVPCFFLSQNDTEEANRIFAIQIHVHAHTNGDSANTSLNRNKCAVIMLFLLCFLSTGFVCLSNGLCCVPCYIVVRISKCDKFLRCDNNLSIENGEFQAQKIWQKKNNNNTNTQCYSFYLFFMSEREYQKIIQLCVLRFVFAFRFRSLVIFIIIIHRYLFDVLAWTMKPLNMNLIC